MANIITIADFIGQNNIPNKDQIGEDLTGFITKYQPMYLLTLFGSDLYASYIVDPTTARFIALLAQPFLKPALVDYVYWFYMEDQRVQNLGVGTGETKNENAITVGGWNKIVRAWNEMVVYNFKINDFLKTNASIYPEYKQVDIYYRPVYSVYYPIHIRVPEIFERVNILGI